MSTATDNASRLPADRDDQVYVSIKPIAAGTVTLPLNLALEDCHDEPDSNAIECPAFSFLITHPTRGNTLFDLGIRKVSQDSTTFCLRVSIVLTLFVSRTVKATRQRYIAGCMTSSKPSAAKTLRTNFRMVA